MVPPLLWARPRYQGRKPNTQAVLGGSNDARTGMPPGIPGGAILQTSDSVQQLVFGGPWATPKQQGTDRHGWEVGPRGPALGNDPSAGSPTETLLRLFTSPSKMTGFDQLSALGVVINPSGASPKASPSHSIGSSDGRAFLVEEQ
ncbi:hypothetical protein N7493_009382 [Penicillium malachiteum]|uniref:Uncharacterized protein n=1 Tax=Penicillium malachiteum TaxID=1324776 RepID=A0AAD6HFB4_9EURO|nr:hypothetical protein N7493_009382 [Penicillium malachiteum]